MTARSICRGGPSPAAAAAVAMLLLVALPAAAQMESPLKGQGTPANETTDVYLSVYLDRLIEVDERNYRHQLIAYFFITWKDPTAYDTVVSTTAAWLAGNRSCARECTDWAEGVACCDDIYMPSFLFRNVYGFPQDRASGYKLVLLQSPNNTVAWQTFVHGIFYQPMDLTHFPFDSWDLLVTLEFLDTGPPAHQGIRVHTSSGGISLYTVGRGDPVSQWAIDGISLQAETSFLAQPQQFFKALSYVPSDPTDPLGLTTTNAAVLRGCRPGATTVAASRNVTSIKVKIRISRFWSYHVLNTVLPVLLLGLLAFVTFFLERSDLSSRLSIVVTLFLAMAAVQFVISENQPASSYVLPTQQAAIATYVLLSLIAVESIVVYRIETWQEAATKRQALLEARARHVAQRKAAKAAAKVAKTEERQQGLPLQQEYSAAPANGSCTAAVADVAIVATAGAGMVAPVTRWRCWRCCGQPCDAAAAPPPPAPPMDPVYDAWVAYAIDRCSLVILFAAYTVAIVLIYALSNGYIDLWD